LVFLVVFVESVLGGDNSDLGSGHIAQDIELVQVSYVSGYTAVNSGSFIDVMGL
jgi:hypothetical protein